MQPVGIFAALYSVILLNALNDLMDTSLNDQRHMGDDKTHVLGFISCLVTAAVTTANQTIAIAKTRDKNFAENLTKLRNRLQIIFIVVVICNVLCSATLICNAIRFVSLAHTDAK